MCPHRCVPFSKWRLDLLRSLCALPEHPQPLIFPLRPRIRASQSQPGTRTYSSGKPSGGAGPSVRNEDSTSEIKEKEDRHAGRYSTIFEDLPTNQPEQRPISSGILEAPSTNETVTETRRRKPQKAWSPYTEDSRQEIKHLLETLENIANQDEDVRRLERNLEARSHRFLPRPKPTDLPQSPILKKVSKREKPAKEIRNPALEPLAHDPWARMLAEPIRQCRASQVRMPVSLLSNWGLTRHPKTDEVYLVPSELADIDNDERVTTREESKWRKRMRELELEANCAPIEGINPYAELRDEVAFEDDASAKQNAAKSRDSGSRPSSSSFHSHSSSGNVRVLLYDNLINLFSLQSLRKIASKTSVARYLVPRQMVDEFERAQHYHKNRKHFESLTGVPNTIPTTTAAAFDLSKVKWKNDIGPRILDILRRRLKIAFVKSASAERSQRQKRMYAVSMIKMMNPSQWHPNTVDRGRARTSAKNDATVHVMSTSATGTPNLKYDDRDAPQTTSERALPPRIYLHLGPPQSPLLRKFSNERRTPMLPPLVSREPGKPESRAQRFPVFPVSAMLGESHYREFLGTGGGAWVFGARAGG